MIDLWASDEAKDVNLGDQRLNRRLREVLSQLGARPTDSIPSACGGYAETAAAYRLFDNDKVRFDKVLEPHIETTRRRLAEQKVVVVPQDTTEMDLTRPQSQVVGAGALDGSNRRGVFLHLLYAFTPDGTPLGTMHAEVWARPVEPLPPAEERAARRERLPIEQKESFRWIEAFRRVAAEAARAPNTHVTTVADSEADIYELLAEARKRPSNLDWLIRAGQNRALRQDEERDGTTAAAEALLRERLLTGEVLFTQSIRVRRRTAMIQCEDRPRRQPRRSRTATVEVRAGRVTLRSPQRWGRNLEPIEVNAVLVRESDPPADDAAVEWLLLTSLPIDTAEQVREVIQCYSVRWMIEIVFRTLKSGCRVQQRRFEDVERFLPCLAVYLIVTWRALYVCRLARDLPEVSCEAIFEPAEWKPVWQVVRRQRPPAQPPTLAVMVCLVAQLGGYVNRKRPDRPGPQTIWLGLQRVHDFALCWNLFGPEATGKTEDV